MDQETLIKEFEEGKTEEKSDSDAKDETTDETTDDTTGDELDLVKITIIR